MDIQSLKAKHAHLVTERVQLSSLKQQSLSVVNLKDEVDTLLQQLADFAQADSISLYSELLSKLLSDVMGKPQEVVLETVKKRDKVHLDVYVIEDGKKIDILDGKGGSVCNILVVGMRIVALLQSPHRRFLFLDEPDCWIEPTLVGRFVAVIKLLCKEVGLQVVYISHHEQSIFGRDVSNLALSGRGSIKVDVLEGHDVDGGFIPENIKDENDNFNVDWLDGHGIKEIVLSDFMSHRNSLLPFSNDMTLLTGENDIGKSAVFRAFKALVNNNPKPSYIRHGQDSASVSLLLENDVRVTWSFSSKKSIKPCYIVNSADGESIFEVKPGDVPEFVTECLNFGEIAGFDLHLADQKDPLFILNENVKGCDRAQLLSFTDDFETVLKMIDEHKNNVKEARAELRVLKHQLDSVNAQLEALKPLPILEALSEALDKPVQGNSVHLEQVINYIQHGDVLDHKSKDVALLQTLLHGSSYTPKSDGLGSILSYLVSDSVDHISILTRLNASSSGSSNMQVDLSRCIDAICLGNILDDMDVVTALNVSTASSRSYIEHHNHALSTVINNLCLEKNAYCEHCGQTIVRQ